MIKPFNINSNKLPSVILTKKKSDLISIRSIAPYYPFVHTNEDEEDEYRDSISLSCWVRIKRDDVWYRVFVSASHLTFKQIKIPKENIITSLLSQIMHTAYKVQNLYIVDKNMFEQFKLEPDPFQIEETERIMVLMNKGFI
jgi:hypothetical protein